MRRRSVYSASDGTLYGNPSPSFILPETSVKAKPSCSYSERHSAPQRSVSDLPGTGIEQRQHIYRQEPHHTPLQQELNAVRGSQFTSDNQVTIIQPATLTP